VGFHPSLDPFLRLAIPLIERMTDINHIYSEVSPWLYFKTLRQKPMVLTIASEKGEPIAEFVDRCDVVAVQTEGMKSRLNGCNIDSSKVRLVYPGIDLSSFSKRSRPVDLRRPKILLATFPRTAEELEGRGVLFLIEAAKRYPEIEVHMVSRPWRSGDTGLSAVKEVLDRDQVANVFVMNGIQEAMGELYNRHDFTVIPYTTADGGKECPRSLIESMACGVPILISDAAPFSSFVAQHNCGCVYSRSVEGFALALEAGLRSYLQISKNAEECAYTYFDREQTYRAYAGIYGSLIS
jgi:glycosyltransferase involved in cell wall biosynthesis